MVSIQNINSSAAANTVQTIPAQPQSTAASTVNQVSTGSTNSTGQSVAASIAPAGSNIQTSYLSAPGASNAVFNFVENQLNKFANYTYHLRWSVTTESNARLVQENGSQTFQNIPKVIIAESGQTALYNITECKITNLLPGSAVTGGTNDLGIEMTVVEPYGITLVDNLYNVASSIGIANYFTTNSYFLEIWFTGYDEDGSIATQSLQNKFYKLYQMQLKKFELDSTEAGTTYRITCLPNNAFGHADHVSIVPNSINIGPIATVGEFFTQLGQKLTKLNADMYNGTAKIEYIFQLPDWMSKWQFTQAPTDTQRNSNIDIIGSNFEKPTISIARGMDINTILNFVVSMTKDGQNYTAGEATANGTPPAGSANLGKNGMVNLIVVHAIPHLGQKDPQTNDYQRQIIYTFHRFSVHRLKVDQLNSARSRIPAQQSSRQAAVAKSNRFVKRYWWTYTGQNLDVLKYEIKLNILAQVGIPSNLGVLNYPNFAQGPLFDTKSVAQDMLFYNKLKSQVVFAQQEKIKYANNSTAINFLDQQISAYQSQIKTLELKYQGTNFVQQSVGQTRAGQATQAAANSAAAGTKAAAAGTQNIPANGSQAATPASAAAQLRETKYLEDVAASNIEPDPIPISSVAMSTPTAQIAGLGNAGPKDANDAGTNSANLPASRSLVSSILYEMGQEATNKIALEIRGDPYWLGISQVDSDKAATNANGQDLSNTDAAWWWSGDVGFLFTVRTGQAYNESTGLMELNNKTLVWNAFWCVQKVENHFNGGQFTQILTAIRDDLTKPPPHTQTTVSTKKDAAIAALQAEIDAHNASLVPKYGLNPK